MSGTLTINNGSNRTVKVISKSTGAVETFVIPNDEDYQLILNKNCEIRISNNEVNTASCRLRTDANSNITMKVLKMSNSETRFDFGFNNNKWLKEFNHNVRDNWNNVTNIRQMFRGCTNLTNVSLPNELPNVINMSYMFNSCTNLTNVTLPNKLPSVTDMNEMFSYCSSLTSITLPNTLPSATTMSRMFHVCTNLTSVTLPNELPRVTDMSYMFQNCLKFNSNLSNTKFKINVRRDMYDSNAPLWITANKPKFVL